MRNSRITDDGDAGGDEMSSQKQSHRVRQYERWHENIVKENEELKKKVAYFERRPPVYRVFQYMKWKKEAQP